MSIVGLALRVVTVKALAGKTFAGSRVFDSAIAPLDVKVEEEAAPLLVVYTDEEDSGISGGDMLVTDRDLSLVLHCAVANQVITEAGGVSVEIPHTDEGLEATLDLMRYDIIAALQTGDDLWCDLWRRLVVKRKSLTVRRGASARKGLRFAAREIVLHVDTVGDPVPGSGDSELFSDFDAALRTDPDLNDIADLIRARLTAGAGWPEWRQVAAALGLSGASRKALGIGPDDPNASATGRLGIDWGRGYTALVTPEGDEISFP